MNVDALFGLRVRTPRLELRLPGDDALEQLYEVAAAGIHPPEEMPFGVAWTDDLSRDMFIGYHHHLRDSMAAGSVEDRSAASGPAASSSVSRASAPIDFAAKRTIATGSWLGARHQGRGIGTEMRAAVVELAFRHLGAEAVTSGAFESNHASRRVSAKLGYREVGREELSPRGTPQPHVVLRLERRDWR